MIKEFVREEFREDLKEGAVLLDFYSKTCGPCKMLAFLLKDIDGQLKDRVKIIKIDFEENKDLIEEYKVEGYPTLVMLKDGVEVSRKSGLQQKPVIVRMMEEVL